MRMSVFAVLVWLVALLPGQERWPPIPIERAQALLEARGYPSADTRIQITYETQTRSAEDVHNRRRWYIWGTPYAWESRVDRYDGSGVLDSRTIYSEGREYHVAKRAEGWESVVQRKRVEYDTLCPVQLYLRPIENTEWRSAVQRYRPFQAEMAGDSLVACFPLSEEIGQHIMEGKPVSGFLCYRARLTLRENGYSLSVLERWVTDRLFENGVWSPNAERITPPQRLKIGKEVEGVLSARYEFDELSPFGPLTLPCKLRFSTPRVSGIVAVTEGSAAWLQEKGDSFEFRAPPEFGLVGVAVDEHGKRVQHGRDGMTPEEALAAMLAKGERLTATKGGDGGAMAIWVVVIAVACAGVVLWFMRGRRS